MHNAVRLFIQSVKGELPYKFKFRSVLEVGSHNINGSPRKYFLFCYYTGIDIGEGKGVDIVARFNEHEFDRKYEVIISTELPVLHRKEKNMEQKGHHHNAHQIQPITTGIFLLTILKASLLLICLANT